MGSETEVSPRSERTEDHRPTAGAARIVGRDLVSIRQALLAWFRQHRRDLPWRDVADPYAVWVSEVMLQQTRVATVAPYYEAWMTRFPTLEALAKAEAPTVLEAWQGLGYYRRARYLHAAARLMVTELGGEVPDTYEALLRLPGVGPYTAGAIASIAYGVRVPAVDGNARRVLARLLGERRDPSRGEAAHRIRRSALDLADCDRPGDANQAVMELGSRVCLPRSPACDQCPIAVWCVTNRDGLQHEIPASSRRATARHDNVWAYALTTREGLMLVAQRREEGLLGGLWELPIVPAASDDSARDRVMRALGEQVREVWHCGDVDHVFTHIRLTAAVYCGRLADGEEAKRSVIEMLAHGSESAATGPWGMVAYAAFRWATRAEIAELPSSRLMAKLLQASEDCPPAESALESSGS